jgi:hypothetical protein
MHYPFDVQDTWAMAATVVGDDPEAVLHEKQHLPVQVSALSGQPCEKVTTGPLPQSL